MKKVTLFLLVLFSVCFNAMPQTVNKPKYLTQISGYFNNTFDNAQGDFIVFRDDSSLGKGQGLYNSTKEQWIILPKYEFSYGFFIDEKTKYGYGVARRDDGKVGVYDTKGNLVISFGKYKHISNACPGFLFIVKNWEGKTGIVDVNDRIICPFNKYDDIFSQGFLSGDLGLSNYYVVAKSKNTGKYGLIYLDGTPATYFTFDWIDSVHNPYDFPGICACFESNGRYYYVNNLWDVVKVEEKYSSSQQTSYSSSYSQNTNSRTNNSSITTAAVIGVFIGLAAAAIDYYGSSSSRSSSSSSSSSSRSSSYSSSSSSYNSSYSSSRSVSICPDCSGRGMMNCVWCHGTGINKGGWFESDSVCSWCKGAGQVWCWHCNGKGSIKN